MLADSDHSEQELDWIIRNEQVGTLADLVMRRTALAVTGRLSARDLARIADLCATALHWDVARRDSELGETQAMLLSRHRLRMDQAASA